MSNIISPIRPIQRINSIKDKLYNLDGNNLYNEQTGNTENDLETMSFQEILNNLEVGK